MRYRVGTQTDAFGSQAWAYIKTGSKERMRGLI
jgi:hypothetical protein